jgi:predicted O-linked N-acetylglucosamine transferase (SPINDLY family)
MATTLPRQLALAEKHFRNGNHHLAETLLREVLTRTPRNAKANELLAYITGNRGELDDSFELLKTATAAPDASGEAHYYLGKHLLERGLFAEAATAYQQALRLNGNFFEGLHDLGVALSGCGKPADAVPVYDQAIRLQPGFAQLWFNKGVALDELKRFDEALQCYDRALAIDPGFAPAWRNRGATLNDLGRYTEALASHEKDIASDSHNAQAWSNRGVSLAALNRFKEALESHEKALTLNPDFAEAWARGAGVFAELKYPDKAVTYFTRALALNADMPYVRGNWLHARMAICQWPALGGSASPASDIESEFEALRADIAAQRRVATPFALLAIPASLPLQRQCAEIYSQDRSPARSAAVTAVIGKRRASNARIKVGYFSPDFRNHPVSFLTAGLFECHDRERFETHAFSFHVPEGDPMTARIKAAFEHFHEVENLPNQAVAALAQNLNLDIAVDLTGHTDGARTGIFARRAAPIQVSYLGFPGTMGAPYIDYILADNAVVPEADAHDYAEKVVFLPHCFQVNDAKRPIAPASTRTACGLPHSAFVFCSFNSVYKINPSLFDVWMNLLQGVQNSVLWLVGENETQMQNLRDYAGSRGVAPQRLIFAGRLPYAEHLARYALADLVLDTLPFNGGTTTSDALWGGTPVLTCSGTTFAGRMATSLLRAIGLDELITPTLEAYQAKALQLAHHPIAVAQLKQKLAANRTTHPLFDTQLCTRHIEAAYLAMCQRHETGLPPDHLHISAAESTRFMGQVTS